MRFEMLIERLILIVGIGLAVGALWELWRG